MRNFEVPASPVFETDIEKWDKTTKDNGEEMAIPVGKIFGNTLYNKAEIERLNGKDLRDIPLPAGAWSNLTFTISDASITENSMINIYFDYNSIPAAQKANIRGLQQTGKLMLTAKKQPATDMVIKLIKIINPEGEV